MNKVVVEQKVTKRMLATPQALAKWKQTNKSPPSTKSGGSFKSSTMPARPSSSGMSRSYSSGQSGFVNGRTNPYTQPPLKVPPPEDRTLHTIKLNITPLSKRIQKVKRRYVVSENDLKNPDKDDDSSPAE